MSEGKIVITGVEFDTALLEGSHQREIMGIRACGWFRGGDHFRAVRPELIPDDVRVAIALMIAPGLVEVKR